MNKKTFLMLALVLVFGVLAAGSVTVGFAAESSMKQSKGKYHCPMHPNFVSDKKGTCGICGMDLVKNDDDEEGAQTSSAVEKSERKILYYCNAMDPSVTSPTPMKDSMGMDYVPVYDEAAASSSNKERKLLFWFFRDYRG